MKTIKQKAESYMSTVMCDETDKTDAQDIAFRAFIAGANEAQHFIPVSEKLPTHANGIEVGTLLLIKTKFDVVYAGWYNSELKRFEGSGDCVIYDVIAWRPAERM